MEPEIEFSATDAQLSDLIKPIVAAIIYSMASWDGSPAQAVQRAEYIINACK